MSEQAKFSFDDHVSLEARSMQLEIPLMTAINKLHREFEDHPVQDEQQTPQIDWSF